MSLNESWETRQTSHDQEHVAFDAAIHAVAAVASPEDMGPMLRKAAKWDPLRRGTETTVPLLARLAATEVANHMARTAAPQHVTAAARSAAEALGLPPAAAGRLATRQAAASVARAAGHCRAAGEAAREAVMAGLPGGATGGEAFLSTALPEAVQAAIRGPQAPDGLVTCAREAAEGAVGKGVACWQKESDQGFCVT